MNSDDLCILRRNLGFQPFIKPLDLVQIKIRLHRTCSLILDLHCPIRRDESYSVKRGLNSSAKSIDPRQPAQSAQADMSGNFSPSLNFLHVKGPVHVMINSVG